MVFIQVRSQQKSHLVAEEVTRGKSDRECRRYEPATRNVVDHELGWPQCRDVYTPACSRDSLNEGRRRRQGRRINGIPQIDNPVRLRVHEADRNPKKESDSGAVFHAAMADGPDLCKLRHNLPKAGGHDVRKSSDSARHQHVGRTADERAKGGSADRPEDGVLSSVPTEELVGALGAIIRPGADRPRQQTPAMTRTSLSGVGSESRVRSDPRYPLGRNR
jgi:hypothetical protein